MARLSGIRIRNYRSIGDDQVDIELPEGIPLVLIGPNNAGKTNIVNSINLLLGDSWPGSFRPEVHDYHNRDATSSLEIITDLRGVSREYRGAQQSIEYLALRFPPDEEGRTFWMKAREEESENPYVSNDVRSQCYCMVVSADRRLQYHLGYSTKFTLLSRLMSQFHSALISDPGRTQDLRDHFDHVKEIFQSVPEFKAFADALSSKVSELSGGMEYGLTVDFSAYDPSNYFHALRVFPNEEDSVRAFDELGTGQEQVLALSFAYAFAKAFHAQAQSLVLVVEEPEAHLHPLAQVWLAQSLRSLAVEGVQVILTTHSPAFISVEGLHGLVVVSKDLGSTSVMQLTPEDLAAHCRQSGAPAARGGNVLDFYAVASTQEILSGLFAQRIVLVEGPTEALSLPIYLRRAGISVERAGIAVIPVAGVGNIAKWWRFFTAYGKPCYVVFDNDLEADPNRTRRTDLLRTLRISQESFERVMASPSPIVGTRATVMGENFESSLRAYFGRRYPELEDEAATIMGGSRSKPLIARFVAERIDEAADERGWELVNTLARAVENAS